jgi:hypothetical protein
MSNSVPRQRLPNRRSHWLYRFESGGQFYTGGIGRFDDGRIAEIFINGPKVGSAAEANAQDAAIVTSLALQYGCPLETIRHALARSGGGAGPLAMLLDEVERQSETRAHERDDHGRTEDSCALRQAGVHQPEGGGRHCRQV